MRIPISSLKGLGSRMADVFDAWPQLFEAFPDDTSLADFLGCSQSEIPPRPTQSSIARQIEESITPGQLPPVDSLPGFIEYDILQMLEAASELQESNYNSSREVSTATIKIDEDKPIGIAFVGDLHIGAMGTDHRAILRILNLIRQTDGLYCVINGDTINNYIARSYDEERHSQPLSPGLQKEIAKVLMEWISPKLLAITSGQHEYWSVKQDDFDPGAYLAKHGNAIYLGPGGSLTIELPRTKYHIGLWHKYRGNSIYDPLAAAKRCYREHGAGVWDITSVADKHEPAIAKEIVHGLERIFVRTGTAKLVDSYAKQLGYSGQRFYVPVAVMDTLDRRLECFLKISSSLSYLKWLRQGGEW